LWTVEEVGEFGNKRLDLRTLASRYDWGKREGLEEIKRDVDIGKGG
jgi:hypothetical protein